DGALMLLGSSAPPSLRFLSPRQWPNKLVRRTQTSPPHAHLLLYNNSLKPLLLIGNFSPRIREMRRPSLSLLRATARFTTKTKPAASSSKPAANTRAAQQPPKRSAISKWKPSLTTPPSRPLEPLSPSLPPTSKRAISSAPL